MCLVMRWKFIIFCRFFHLQQEVVWIISCCPNQVIVWCSAKCDVFHFQVIDLQQEPNPFLQRGINGGLTTERDARNSCHKYIQCDNCRIQHSHVTDVPTNVYGQCMVNSAL
jgi:hypothetical protein